jgi:hypothetical protein
MIGITSGNLAVTSKPARGKEVDVPTPPSTECPETVLLETLFTRNCPSNIQQQVSRSVLTPRFIQAKVNREEGEREEA